MSQDGDELALAIEYSHVLNGARPLFLEQNGMLPNVGEDHYWFKRVSAALAPPG